MFEIIGLCWFLFVFFMGIGVAFVGYSANEPLAIAIGLFFAFLVVIPLIILLRNLYKASRVRKARKSAPKYSSPAKVIDKTFLFLWGFVSYELSDGSRKIFHVSIEQYFLVSKNDVGTLTYKEQGNNLFFVEFKPRL